MFISKIRKSTDRIYAFGHTVAITLYAALSIIGIGLLNVPVTTAEPLTTQAPVQSAPVTVEQPTPKTAPTTPDPEPASAATASSPTRQAPTQPIRANPEPTYDRVAIPSIGLLSQMVPVGLTATNSIDVDTSRVGWWNGSARPGSDGTAFLDGHNPGVFKNLQNIALGAPITVTYTDGSSYTYTVAYKEVVALDGLDMRRALSSYGAASQGLNLMTCMGAYNPATGTTDQRLIVYATR